jgi:trimeric autotransporter adhesin
MKYFRSISTFALFTFLTLGCDSDEPAADIPEYIIETVAGSGPGSLGYEGDGGDASNSKLAFITGISVDSMHNIFVADGASNTVRKINASTNIITTVAGVFLGFNVTDPNPLKGDGGAAASAHLQIPWAVHADLNGNLIILDAGNNLVRQVDQNGIITSLTSKASAGYNGNGGPSVSASIWNPQGAATDQAGNIYFADTQNNAIRMISKNTGIITTVAGLGPQAAGYSGDNGPATQAKLNSPKGIAMDWQGNLYIGDSGNNVIRKVSGGIITTIAGNGTEGYAGDGGPALGANFRAINAVAIDIYGNIYVADSGNNAIRKIDTSGKISTLAGNGVAGYSGDGGDSKKAKLSNPVGVAAFKDRIYVADTGNSSIRVITKND